MLKHKPLTLVVILITGALLACSLPGAGPSPDITVTFAAALTQAFATAQAANLPGPGVATQAPSATPPPGSTSTPSPLPPATVVKPSDTAAPSNTPGAQGCSDGAEYVADVTIPDNTVLNPGQAFTKTWRIKNSGTCTWVGSYQFAFVADNQLGGPAAVPINGNVAPGSLYDVSVNLVAPSAPGTYKGSWRMKNSAGQLFGSTPFVQIVVAAPTNTNTAVPPSATPSSATAASATATATATTAPPSATPSSTTLSVSNNGQVYSDGSVSPGVNNVGDTAANISLQGFVTFNLSTIPSTAIITSARLEMSPFDQLGNAFALGHLRVYKQDYQTVDSGDFFTGTTTGALWRFASTAELTDPTKQSMDAAGLAVLQSALASGQIQLRLQFNETATNNDGADNILRPTPKLIVSYIVP